MTSRRRGARRPDIAVSDGDGKSPRMGRVVYSCALMIVASTSVLTGCGSEQLSSSLPSPAGTTGAATDGAPPCPTAPVAVVVSVDQWGDIASQLGGACATVKTVLASSSVDPHDYEPSPADAASFTGARLVFVNGADYDHWATDLAASSGPRDAVGAGVPRANDPRRSPLSPRVTDP